MGVYFSFAKLLGCSRQNGQDLVSSLKAHSYPSWKPLVVVSAPTSRVIVNTKYLTHVQAMLQKCNLKRFVVAVMCNKRLALSASAFAHGLYPLLDALLQSVF